MNDLNIQPSFDLHIDEFGTIEILDPELPTLISAAADLQYFVSNTACGSNGACVNGGCGQ